MKYLYQLESFHGGPDSDNGYLSISNMGLSFNYDKSQFTLNNINLLQYKVGLRHDWDVVGPNCREYFDDSNDDKGLLCEAHKDGSNLTYYFLFNKHGGGNTLYLTYESTQLIFTS